SSSRSVYPQFFSLHETLLLHASWTWQGFKDAFRWDIVFTTITGDSEIRANVYKSLMLNALSLVSVFTFDLLLHPLLSPGLWFHRSFGHLYQALWLFPIIGLSFYLNSSWCSIIAKRTFVLQHGSRASAEPTTYTGILNIIATSAYRVIMVFMSVVVSFALGFIPYVGSVVEFVFICWVDAYYCFEFVWIARGLSLASRVRHLEERWAYYFAFGFPPAALCIWSSSLANAAVSALIFPLYIIMAMSAHPVPQDPYIPVAPAAHGHGDVSHLNGADDAADRIRHPSPYVPIRMPVFAIVMTLNDLFVRLLNFGSGRRSKTGRGS
ncbi:hypothetical protein FISHEDRAFT_17946, partial [Fistulina hepatica ATCC 64428]